MRTTLQEFRQRVTLTQNIKCSEAESRLKGLFVWMIETNETKIIIGKITSENKIVISDKLKSIPATPGEIASFGIYLLDKIADGAQLYQLGNRFNIKPSYSTSSIQDMADAVIDRYIYPTLEIIEEELEMLESEHESNFPYSEQSASSKYPLEIHESLQLFLNDYPDIDRNAFIMMRFGNTKAHKSILLSIKSVLNKYGINALRADDKEYHEDLFPNVLTYLHGCKFGIAVFERLEEEEFNPNVSLEVGYLRAFKKPICLLKDKTLKTLQTDLVGKLYKSFDPQDPDSTIPKELEKWLRDKDIIT